MQPRPITASALINAPPQQVYAILSDYRDGHPHILPKEYFPSHEVEKGGIGAGTIIRFQMRVAGATRSFRSEITEPVPGRLLVETDLMAGSVTTFTVNPRDQGRHAEVTVTTELPQRKGIAAALERIAAPLLLRRIYARELELLAALAEERSRAYPPPTELHDARTLGS